MRNRKYTATKKNGGNIPELPIANYREDIVATIRHDGKSVLEVTRSTPIRDDRVLQILVPCGECIECREQKAHEWQVRLGEEIKDHTFNYFVTLTFSPTELLGIIKKSRLGECNALAGYALRHSLERWRKDEKKSLRHWFVTELGHKSTERIHMHGLILSDKPLEFEKIERSPQKNGWLCNWKYWKYGMVFLGDYVNQQTVNYIVKYITKVDEDHKNFKGQIFASPGIGKSWIEKLEYLQDETYKYKPGGIWRNYYTLNNGCRVALPRYYKNKQRNEEEREQIWREFLDMNKVTIMGNDYRLRDHEKSELQGIREKAQEVNKEVGYGDNSQEWRKIPYNYTERMIRHVEKEKGAIEGAKMRKKTRIQ